MRPGVECATRNAQYRVAYTLLAVHFGNICGKTSSKSLTWNATLQAQVKRCEPSGLARTAWLESLAGVYASDGASLPG